MNTDSKENKKIHVVIVDDQTVATRSIMSMLKNSMISTTAFDTPACGKFVLEWLDNKPNIDFIILDLLINGVSGVDIAKKFRSLYPTTPILFMTGCATGSEKYREALAFSTVNKGCYFYHKPFDQSIRSKLKEFIFDKIIDQFKDQ